MRADVYTRPLRANGIPYRGINVLMLWAEAQSKGYTAPIWITFKQALDLVAHVRKGEHGSLVVYASKTSSVFNLTSKGVRGKPSCLRVKLRVFLSSF